MRAQFDFILNYQSQLLPSFLLLGDFNAFLKTSEKVGGDLSFHAKMRLFNDFYQNMGVLDLGFSSPMMTWNNRRDGTLNIQERIDRGLASASWLNTYPRASIQHLSDQGSDHRPLLLLLSPQIFKSKGYFYFDARWTNSQDITRHILRLA